MRSASHPFPVRARCRSALQIRGYAPFDVADMELPAPSAANLELPAPADVLNSVSAALAVNNSVSAALSEGDAADNSISAAFDALRPHATPNRRYSFNTDMPATTIAGKGGSNAQSGGPILDLRLHIAAIIFRRRQGHGPPQRGTRRGHGVR